MSPDSTSAQAQRDVSAHALRARSEAVDAIALEAALRRHLRGGVRFDAGSPRSLRTDGLQLPSGSRSESSRRAIPKDVLASVALCREYKAPLLARGGGTSLAGQCCNVAVVLDFSKYMARILEVDPARRLAAFSRA